jgi:hypothetical protein
VPSQASTAAPSGYEELYEEAKRARRRHDYAAVLDLAARAVAAQETAQALALQAEARTALGDPLGALPIAERATELRPRFSTAWYIKGRILRTLGAHARPLAPAPALGHGPAASCWSWDSRARATRRQPRWSTVGAARSAM